MPTTKASDLRRKARELALQALHEADVAGHSAVTSLDWLKEEAALLSSSADYALQLVEGVGQRREEIDRYIHRFAPAWPVKQLPVVDRNILRLALFEIRYGDGTPHRVAINEAIELAKTFGGESSPRFVNGVLGSVMDEVVGAEEGPTDGSSVATGSSSQEGRRGHGDGL